MGDRAGASNSERAAPPPTAAAAAPPAAAARPPLGTDRDAYARRLWRLIEGAPPGGVSADLLNLHESMELVRHACDALDAPGVSRGGVLRACADALRGLNALAESAPELLIPIERRGKITAACEAGVGDAAVARVSLWIRAAAYAGAGGRGAAADAAGAVDAGAAFARSALAFVVLCNPEGRSVEGAGQGVALLEGLADWWAAPGRAAHAAARLAELGVADAPRAVRELRLALARMGVTQRWMLLQDADLRSVAASPAAARAFVARCEAMQALAPEGVVAAMWLSKALAELREPRRTYAAAMRGAARAAAAGREHVALTLDAIAAEAVQAGALGDFYTTRQLRPLVESMRRHADRAKEWLPRMEAEAMERDVASYEDFIAARSPTARFSTFWRPASYGRVELRRCARCGVGALEMPLCSRCRGATYCSPACQRAHWPEHKAACKAAAAAPAGDAA